MLQLYNTQVNAVDRSKESLPVVRLIVIEDNRHTVSDIVEDVSDLMPNKVEMRIVGNERAFREQLDAFESDPPDAFVIDVMLAWDYPRSDPLPPPPDVAQNGFFRAGLRCAQLLDGRPSLKSVPRVFYTALDKADIESEIDRKRRLPLTRVVEKDSGSEYLVRALNQVLSR